MSISAISGSDAYALYRQRHTDMATLTDAVQSGNATAAQAALVNSQGGTQPASSTTASDGTTSTAATPVSIAAQIKADLSDLVSAVQSGDMTSAQSALKAYQTDAFGTDSDQQPAEDPTTSGTQGPHGHHHHHHGGAGKTQSTDTSANGIDPTTTTNADGTTTTGQSSDPIENLLQEIGQKLQSATGVTLPTA